MCALLDDKMESKRIHFKVSPEMLEEIDKAAAASWQSRSEYLRETIALRLNRQEIFEQPSKDDIWEKLVERMKSE